MLAVRIGIIGDFDSSRPGHRATNESLWHAAATLSTEVDIQWLPTPSLLNESVDSGLKRFDAFLAASGSPYRSIDGALRGVQFAREHDRPFVGT